MTSIDRGDISQMSFAFRTVKDSIEHLDDDKVIRTLLEVKLYDVSPVTYPAYTQTDIKLRDLEAAKIKEPDLAVHSDIFLLPIMKLRKTLRRKL